MLNKALKLAVLACCLFLELASATPVEKLATLKRVNLFNDELLRIAAQRQSLSQKGMSTSGPEIGRLVETLGDLDLLVRAALASRANRSPGRAEDQIVDDVMDEAWTRCVVRIERIGGKGAIEALQTIEQRARLDGADSLAVREALERLGPRN